MNIRRARIGVVLAAALTLAACQTMDGGSGGSMGSPSMSGGRDMGQVRGRIGHGEVWHRVGRVPGLADCHGPA